MSVALAHSECASGSNHGFKSSVVYIRYFAWTSAMALAVLLNSAVFIATLLDLVSFSQAARTAYVEIIVTDNTDKETTYTDKFEGTFANIGAFSRAQGDVVQVRA